MEVHLATMALQFPSVRVRARLIAVIHLCFMGVREAVSAAEVSGKALELI